MAASFMGKWKRDPACTTGFEEFGAAMGFSEERMKIYQNLVYTIEFSSSGDTYTATVDFEGNIPSRTYTFKMGETFDYISIDGTKPKLTITMDGEKIKEDFELEGKEWQTIREVNGTVMTVTTSVGGTSMVQILNKQ